MPWRSLPYCLRSFCDLRLELLHRPLRLDLLDEQREQDQPDGDDQEHDRQRPGDAARPGPRNVENSECHVLHHPGDGGVQPVKQRRTPPSGPGAGPAGWLVGDAVTAGLRCRRPCSTTGRPPRFRDGSSRSGTRSTPPGCQGAHLTSRRSASQLPRPAPCRVDRLGRVGAAGRVEAAARRQGRADRPRVEARSTAQQPRGGSSRTGTRSPQQPVQAGDEVAVQHGGRRASAASGRARTTRSAVGGQPVQLVARRRPAAAGSPGGGPPSCRRPCRPRNRPAHRPAARAGATREPPVCSGRSGRKWSTMVGRPARRPDRTTAVNSGRRRRRACAGNTSGGELLATLAPTAGEDRPARAGAHPQPEAVGLGPTAVVRLERALAHEVLPLHDIDGAHPPVGGRARGDRGGRRWPRSPATPEAGHCGPARAPAPPAPRSARADGGRNRPQTPASITEERAAAGRPGASRPPMVHPAASGSGGGTPEPTRPGGRPESLPGCGRGC